MGRAGGDQLLDCCHDFGDARFVVRAEQRGPVGDDQFLTDELRNAGAESLSQRDSVVQLQLAALIADDARLHMLTRGIWRGVHVGDQRQHRRVCRVLCRERRKHIAGCIHADIRQAKLVQLLHQKPPKILLPLRRGRRAGRIIRRRIVCHIPQKAFLCIHALFLL